MSNLHRPFLIIPKLILKPTWGGTYIAEMKGWANISNIQNKVIGQSYELFSGTKLALLITDTYDPRFMPEVGYDDSPETQKEGFGLKEEVDYINIPESADLLIKINHSKGNSFQLHRKPGLNDSRWINKAEAWYYLEHGKLTFGVKKEANLEEYKKVCLEIEGFMKGLSLQVTNGQKGIDDARVEAEIFIKDKNPWQFVNMHEVKKYEIVDPSLGGIHHSWEEDDQKYPLGNVVYEVQEDVMDPVSTIRCFDQGKIKDDGSIREIHIEDYFKYLDTNEVNNDINRSRDLNNAIFAMDVLTIETTKSYATEKSFHHLFVRDGGMEVVSGGVTLKVNRGHSVYVPSKLSYIINPMSSDTVILKTYSNK